jgi:hypothetical protein
LTENRISRTPDLIDQFTDLVLGGNEPRRLAEQTLDIVLTLTHGRCAAVFRIEDGKALLFASRGLDQMALDAAQADWASHRTDLARGGIVDIPAAGAESPRAHVTTPVRAGARLIGFVYVDGAEPHFLDEDGRRRLAKFEAILARALDAPAPPPGERPRGWERDLDGNAALGAERERLLMMLERNEWNIARVARLMNVTRRTIYLRLERYGLPRERVRKDGRAQILK